MIERSNTSLSIRQQCNLLSINRSTLYYEPRPSNDSMLANEIQEIWLEMPFYGYRRITAQLRRRGYDVNHKCVLRLMNAMNLQALYPRPKTTKRNKDHKVYPYLLRDLLITRPNQVWATDITYIAMPTGGFMYLVALIDVYSRFILSWRLSNTLDTTFCLDMLDQALSNNKPEIINTDQGCQFTSLLWINRLNNTGIQISMDGVGRCSDNIIIERFWRTIKHEHILVHSYNSVPELKESITSYITLYNEKRLHQSLGYNTPEEVYNGIIDKRKMTSNVMKMEPPQLPAG